PMPCGAGTDSLRVTGAGKFLHSMARQWNPQRARCDLIASILNPNCSFSATTAQESEITGKFLLVFNKFTRTITNNSALFAIRTGRTGSRRDIRGGGHETEYSRRCPARQAAGHLGRCRRFRAEPGPEPLRPVPARALLHARARSQMARQ